MIHSRQIEKVAEARIANCQLPIANCQLAVMISGEELITRTIMMMTTTATIILMTMISIMMIHSLNNNKRSPASAFQLLSRHFVFSVLHNLFIHNLSRTERPRIYFPI